MEIKIESQLATRRHVSRLMAGRVFADVFYLPDHDIYEIRCFRRGWWRRRWKRVGTSMHKTREAAQHEGWYFLRGLP